MHTNRILEKHHDGELAGGGGDGGGYFPNNDATVLRGRQKVI